jgi:hypothetical protein
VNAMRRPRTCSVMLQDDFGGKGEAELSPTVCLIYKTVQQILLV